MFDGPKAECVLPNTRVEFWRASVALIVRMRVRRAYLSTFIPTIGPVGRPSGRPVGSNVSKQYSYIVTTGSADYKKENKRRVYAHELDNNSTR
jgi:hypothetical protein